MDGLSQGEKQQYSRHLILDEIGEIGQLQLKKAKVLVVGAGGLGCPVLQYITAAGVGTIGIVDGDTVDVTNLQRQILFTVEDIGQFKAVVAARRMEKMNPHVSCKVYTEFFSKNNAMALMSEFDIVVDASDNFPTRYLINDAAVLTQRPVVFGSISKFEGQVSVYNFKGGPTYRCLYPQPPLPQETDACSEVGVLGVLPGIIGALQANEVIKIICGLGEVLSGQLLHFNALSLQQIQLAYEKSASSAIVDLSQDYQVFCGVASDSETISWKAYKAREKDYHLLDVREDWEQLLKPIGGWHIPVHELPEKWSDLPVDLDWVVYCETGVRTQQAIELLKEMGFERNLYSLKQNRNIEEY